MTTWQTEELDRIATADELRVAGRRPDGTLNDPVTIWVVRHGDDLYVRSMRGTDAKWYRGTRSKHEGRIRSGGVDRDVRFVDEADPGTNKAVDAAYRAKYRRYEKAIVDPMLASPARATTMKLLPE